MLYLIFFVEFVMLYLFRYECYLNYSEYDLIYIWMIFRGDVKIRFVVFEFRFFDM